MKILVAIANYGTKNKKHVVRLIEEYKAMSYDVHIVILSNVSKELGQDIEVLVGLPIKDPWSLPFGHKKIFAERINEYDLFIYSEDDTLITERNIDAFLEVTKILSENEIAGFMRFEEDGNGQKYCSTIHGPYHWKPDSVKTLGTYTFAEFTNEHSACFILTRRQLNKAIQSGGFMVEPHKGRHDMLCSAATDPYTQCGFTKVICISQFEEFLIHHMPNQYIGRMGLAMDDVWKQIYALHEIGQGKKSSGQLLKGSPYSNISPRQKSYYEREDPNILSAVPDNAKDILSIGSGWGSLEKALNKRGCTVECVPLDSVISVGLEAEGIKVYEPDMDMAMEASENKQYGCIILSQLLHFIEDPQQLLKRLSGCLQENGKIIVTIPNMNHVKIKYQAILGRDACTKEDKERSNGHQVMTLGQIKKWYKESGIVLTKCAFQSDGRYRKYDDMSLGIFKSILSSEIFIEGNK